MVERGGLEKPLCDLSYRGFESLTLRHTYQRESHLLASLLKGKACPLRGQALLVPDCFERTINNRLQPESVTHTHPETGLVIDIFV